MIAILIPLTMLVVWALALPVRGRLDTILSPSAANAGAEKTGSTVAARTSAERSSRVFMVWNPS